MSTARLLLVAALPLLGACGHHRFLDRPIVWFERDDRPIPRPRASEGSVHHASMDAVVFWPIDRGLSLDYGVEAENVNALDEVPDSSWFEDPRRDSPEHRWRPRALTSDEMRRGATRPEDQPVLPLTIWRTKSAGSTPGFVAKDARGVRYVVKLDGPGPVGLATSAEVVASRLFWAGGWRVPSIGLVDVAAEDLRWQPGLDRRDALGDPEPYTAQMHAELLGRAPRVDGKIRALVSRWIEGESLGSFPFYGRRADDANDFYRHENRRDLRGMGVFAAWVNDVDTLENNTMDAYVGLPGDGHVVHYQQDVGGCFGTWAAKVAPPWMGHEGYFRAGGILESLLTFGIRPRTWEGAEFQREHASRVAAWPELGGFDAERFDPRTWRPAIPNPAFDRVTDRDQYWGAKRVVAFSEEELRAAIEAGRYPPRVAERLFQVLWERRRRIGEAYLGKQAALDYFRIGAEPQTLCFDDLYSRAGLGSAQRYAARELDARRALPIRWRGSEGCIVLAPRDGYRVVELLVVREGGGERRVRLHLVEDGRGRRIVGVQR